MNASATTYSDSKKHYEILDGLRGVAAVTVVLFHILETFTDGNHTRQLINHGYLAVDFFFLLSGFVIGYAYDDRWHSMRLGGFFKRRLIRLHPMIIIGMLIGAVLFYFQGGTVFPQIKEVAVGKLLLVFLIGCTLLPVPGSFDIRGWSEMHPLNGPAWSLFFEYIANLLYALFIRKFSNTLLAIFVGLSGAALVHLAVTSPHGDLIGGWSLEPEQFRIGLTRLCYPFFAGLLLSRIVQPAHINKAFTWSSLLLLIVLAMPRIGDATHVWANGLYDSLSVVLLFPVIVYIGASGTIQGKRAAVICSLLGDISYPLYIIHYPFIYLFMAWVADHKTWIATASSGQTVLVLVSVLVLVTSIAVAYVSLKLYDIPVRRWLMQRFIRTGKS